MGGGGSRRELREVRGEAMPMADYAVPPSSTQQRRRRSPGRVRAADIPSPLAVMAHHAAPEGGALAVEGGLSRLGRGVDAGLDHDQALSGIDEDRLPVDAEHGEAPVLAGKEPELIAIAPKGM